MRMSAARQDGSFSVVVRVQRMRDGEVHLLVRTMCQVDDEPVEVAGPTAVSSFNDVSRLVTDALGTSYSQLVHRHSA
jgi:hypothetical protein